MIDLVFTGLCAFSAFIGFITGFIIAFLAVTGE